MQKKVWDDVKSSEDKIDALKQTIEAAKVARSKQVEDFLK